MTHEIVLQLLGPVGAAVGVYVGIRADLAILRAGLEHAHKRIDEMKAGK